MAEEIKKVPSMELAQCRYLLTLPTDVVPDKNKIRKRLLEIVEEKGIESKLYFEY